VCLKISRSGGISGLLRDARSARDAGSAVYLASTYDGPLGIAAALHAAAALAADGPLPACGLATLDAFEDVPNPFVFHDGTLAPPSGPGLLAEPA
jgi:L-alanine-DL-glutamate epimerase-like enolase superfamily enzyme